MLEKCFFKCRTIFSIGSLPKAWITTLAKQTNLVSMYSLNCYFPLYQFDALRLEVVRQLDFCIRSYPTIQNTICLLCETGPLITKLYHRYGCQIVISYNQKAIRVDINVLYWLRGFTDTSGHVKILIHILYFSVFMNMRRFTHYLSQLTSISIFLT